MARQLKLFAILTSLAAGPCTAMAQSAAVNLDGVVIVQEFIANGDAGQCNGRAYGAILSQAASWSPAIFIDTDSRPGGCFYRIGIVDPGGVLRAAGFGLNMVFAADGDPGQCGGQGSQPVPINASFDDVKMTTPIFMDMDNRSGGCLQTWSVTGSNVVLDINFSANGDAGQCGNAGTHTAPPDVTLKLDTDDRTGGCLQSIRLRNAQAQAVSVKSEFERYGLLGMFAVDCTQPPSSRNIYEVYRAIDDGHVQADQMSGPTTRDFALVFDQITDATPNQLAAGGIVDGRRQSVVLRIEGSRVRTMEMAREPSERVIADGRRVDNGEELPWHTKCGTPWSIGPRPNKKTPR
jgi:hypothetical protein